ncbi:MAG: hypothetical protein JXR40_14260 [Pontiellaceae bacterium]|nr:hypothetical protein [Pontiellaceae bacterium]
MKKVLEIVSYLALVGIVVAPLLFYAGTLDLEQNKFWMLVATVVWFGSASLWIGAEKKGGPNDAECI